MDFISFQMQNSRGWKWTLSRRLSWQYTEMRVGHQWNADPHKKTWSFSDLTTISQLTSVTTLWIRYTFLIALFRLIQNWSIGRTNIYNYFYFLIGVFQIHSPFFSFTTYIRKIFSWTAAHWFIYSCIHLFIRSTNWVLLFVRYLVILR